MRTLFTTLSLAGALILGLGCDGEPSTAPDAEALEAGGPQAEAASKPFQAAAAPTSTPTGSVTAETIVATWEGGQLSYGEVSEKIKNQLIQMEVEYLTNRYAAEQQAIDQMMIETLLEDEAKARGLEGIEALLKVEVEDKVAVPTDAEVLAFYEVVKRQLNGAPLEAVRDRVAGELLRRKQAERGQAFIAEIKAKRGGAVKLPFPDLPRIEVSVDDDPMMGSPDAQVTIVQFAEYQCPYCGKATDTVEQVLADYEGKVRMVYRDFPLSFHPRAVPAAVAANCAGEQGKYWEMHKLLMGNQRALEEQDLMAHAQALSLDINAWNTCRQDPKQEAEVMADMEAGAEAGVSGTPAFFVNGILMSGALQYERFKEIIDRELDRG